MLGRARVPSLARALELIEQSLAFLPSAPAEEVALAGARERVLAETIRAHAPLPPYPRSTMDGFAVLAADTYGASETTPAYLRLTGEVRMGEPPVAGPERGGCVAIPTGGFLPRDADAVVMLEHTVTVDAAMVEVMRPVAAGEHVIAAGDDVESGEVLLTAGHCLRSQDIGLLAGLGRERVTVRTRPRVGVISTGDEIVSHTDEPPLGKVRDMNGPLLCALAGEWGAEAKYYGVAPDEEGALFALVARAVAECEIVVFSGGSSVGTRDQGERVVARLDGAAVVLHGVAIRPGKPVIYALAQDTAVFGMPGHPVSAAVAFRLLARPVIRHCAGLTAPMNPPERHVRARLARNINSAPGRTDIVQVALHREDDGAWSAVPVLGKSGALSIMVRADGFFLLPEATQGLEKGSGIEVVCYP